jgi:glycosyltransferase involved in cell wall biosynthesis
MFILNEQSVHPNAADAHYLFVLPWSLAHQGGVNEVVRNLARQLAATASLRPLLMVNSGGRVVETQQTIPTVVSDLRHPLAGPYPVLAFLTYLLRLPFTSFVLWRFLRRYKVRVVNPHYPGLPYLILGWLRRFGLTQAKLVLSFHRGDIELAGKTAGCERVLWHHLLGLADHLIACSNGVREMVEEFDATVAGKTTVVRNGVNAGQLGSEMRESNSLPRLYERSRTIICVGRFEEQKNHALLLNAFRTVASTSEDVRLILVGASGPTSASTKALIANLHLGDRVRVFEDVDHAQVLHYLHQSSLFVLPSRSEGFPLAVLEAGAIGLAVVATRVAGIREIIQHGHNGLLVEDGDDAALAAAMKRVLDRPLEAAHFARNLQHYVTQDLTWEKACQRYLELIGVDQWHQVSCNNGHTSDTRGF